MIHHGVTDNHFQPVGHLFTTGVIFITAILSCTNSKQIGWSSIFVGESLYTVPTDVISRTYICNPNIFVKYAAISYLVQSKAKTLVVLIFQLIRQLAIIARVNALATCSLQQAMHL
mgnify:CR=1 FL=1